MDLTLDDDQRLLAESARQLFERSYTTESARAAEDRDQRFAPELWTQVCELGWPGIALPEEHGGAGYGTLELAILAEELGRGAATVPLLSSYAATLPLLWAGTDALRAFHLPRLASGEATAALALIEPGGGDERTPPALEALEHGDGWLLSGTKVAVPFGCVVDVLVVSVTLGAAGPGIGGSRDRRARHRTHAARHVRTGAVRGA